MFLSHHFLPRFLQFLLLHAQSGEFRGNIERSEGLGVGERWEGGHRGERALLERLGKLHGGVLERQEEIGDSRIGEKNGLHELLGRFLVDELRYLESIGDEMDGTLERSEIWSNLAIPFFSSISESRVVSCEIRF